MISLAYYRFALSCTFSRYLCYRFSLSHTLALHSKDLLLNNHELTSQWLQRGLVLFRSLWARSDDWGQLFLFLEVEVVLVVWRL